MNTGFSAPVHLPFVYSSNPQPTHTIQRVLPTPTPSPSQSPMPGPSPSPSPSPSPMHHRPVAQYGSLNLDSSTTPRTLQRAGTFHMTSAPVNLPPQYMVTSSTAAGSSASGYESDSGPAPIHRSFSFVSGTDSYNHSTPLSTSASTVLSGASNYRSFNSAQMDAALAQQSPRSTLQRHGSAQLVPYSRVAQESTQSSMTPRTSAGTGTGTGTGHVQPLTAAELTSPRYTSPSIRAYVPANPNPNPNPNPSPSPSPSPMPHVSVNLTSATSQSGVRFPGSGSFSMIPVAGGSVPHGNGGGQTPRGNVRTINS